MLAPAISILFVALTSALGSADVLDDALLRIGATRASLAVDTAVQERDPFRLSIVDELMAEPLRIADWTHAAASEIAGAGSLEEMIRPAAARLDLEVGRPPRGRPTELPEADRLPEALREPISRLVGAMAAAEPLRVEAFARLSEPERKALDAGWRFFVGKVRGSENVEDTDPVLMAAAEKVDLAKLVTAARGVAEATDELCAALVTWRTGLTWQEFSALAELHHEVTTHAGKLIVNGTGEDEVTETAAIIIDLGGDDSYLCPVAFGDHALSVCVDLSGADRYQCMDDGPFAVGLMGVGIHADLGGMDNYRANDLSIGAGLCGVGVLWDRGGEDLYESGQFTQGTAYFGLGILRDEALGDRYSARWLAQGAGGPRGLGALVDRAGDDDYYCGGRHYGWSTSANSSRSGCQGYGEGIRHVASGGIGLLVDTAGSDSYTGGSLSQGFGYWFGIGCLVDHDGDDTYSSPHYAQGSAVHLGLGALLDHAGDDRYLGQVTTQGTAYDWSFAMLVDYAGDDYYLGKSLASGAGGVNGSALLIDNSGDDTYDVGAPKAIALGGGQFVESRGWGSIGVFIDCAGDDSFLACPDCKGTTWVKTSIGVGMDADGAAPPFAQTMSVADPAATGIEDLIVAESIPAENSRQAAEVCYRILVVPGYPKELVEEATARFYAMPEHSLPLCIEKLTAVPFYQVFPNIRTVLPGFGEAAVAPLIEQTSSPDPLRRAHAILALGGIESAASTATLLAAATDPHEWVRAAAATALGNRKPEGAVAAVLPLLSDPAPEVRLKAAQALGAMGDASVATELAKLLGDPVWKASDGAATALAKLGAPALEPVRSLMQTSADPAVAARCRRVIEAIEAAAR